MSGATDWITSAAHPLAAVDPNASLSDLAPLGGMIGDASIVGVARGTHGACEFSQLTHRILRFLVQEHGFRSLAIETSWTTGLEVDAWLQTGRGEVTDRLRETHSWWRLPEFLEVLSWMRGFNEQHVDDPVRLVGLDVAADDMSVLERRLATNVLRWRAHTGHKILFWSGSHSAVGHDRTVSWAPSDPGVTSRNAGSYLREHLGAAYLSAGLTFHHGSVNLDGTPVLAPPPPPEFTDAVLGVTRLERYLLDLRVHDPDLARAVTDSPATLRLIGPRYDPGQPASMTGGPLSEFFDIVVHMREVTPAGRRP